MGKLEQIASMTQIGGDFQLHRELSGQFLFQKLNYITQAVDFAQKYGRPLDSLLLVLEKTLTEYVYLKKEKYKSVSAQQTVEKLWTAHHSHSLIYLSKGGETMSKALVLKVHGMTCLHCKNSVEKALKAVPGVISAAVDLAKQEATVTGSANFDELVKVVEDLGYSVIR